MVENYQDARWPRSAQGVMPLKVIAVLTPFGHNPTISPASSGLDDRIRAVLRPLMPDRERRQARLGRAFAAYPGLLDRFTYDGETSVFLSSLIQTLFAYGDVERDVPAFAVLLKSVK